MRYSNELSHVGTFAWAAEQLGVSIQQVRRYVKDGLITRSSPRCGSREAQRTLLLVADVDSLKAARKVVGRG